jgi:hypothetical protein
MDGVGDGDGQKLGYFLFPLLLSPSISENLLALMPSGSCSEMEVQVGTMQK